jgi:hypothetical protein
MSAFSDSLRIPPVSVPDQLLRPSMPSQEFIEAVFWVAALDTLFDFRRKCLTMLESRAHERGLGIDAFLAAYGLRLPTNEEYLNYAQEQRRQFLANKALVPMRRAVRGRP